MYLFEAKTICACQTGGSRGAQLWGVDKEGLLRSTYQETAGGSWSGWSGEWNGRSPRNVVALTAAQQNDGRVALWVLTPDNTLYCNCQTSAGGECAGWERWDDVRNEIKHIVVLMLENRSFDNVLGWLYADESNRPRLNIPAADPPTFDGLVEKGFSNIRYKGGPPVYAKKGVTKPIKNPDEDYPSFLEQIFGFDPKSLFFSGKVVGLKANMKGFLESYAKVDANAPERIMESYSSDQLAESDIVIRIVNGGVNMPAFGNSISPEDLA